MYDIIYSSMISYSVEARTISYDNRVWYHSTFHMIRVPISYHNIIYDIINWNAMILDMISYVSLCRYYLCRQPPPLLPGCNRDTGYTAANLQRWPAHPTEADWAHSPPALATLQRCSVAEVWHSLWQGGRERRNTELGSGHSTSCEWGARREGGRAFICKSRRVGTRSGSCLWTQAAW